MSEEKKRYTAKELRCEAETYSQATEYDFSVMVAMLRQAADTEELLEEKQFRLNEALRILEETREHRLILLNRLEAILKECEKAKSRMSCDACRSHARRNKDIPECETDFMRCEKQEYDAIIKLARGEGVDKK